MAIGRPLGSGGEATVYAVLDDDGQERLALKWFTAERASEAKRQAIAALLELRPISGYLWPLVIVTDPEDQNRFGYLMDRRDPNLVELNRLPSVGVAGLYQRLRICFELADRLSELHNAGLGFRDLNRKNVAYRPASGEVVLCDLDNVGPDGSPTLVKGVREYMAPETSVGGVPPGCLTDRHSLAVLLFTVLFGLHPLDGRRYEAELVDDDDAKVRHFGRHPLFIFDPDDDANGLAPDLYDHHRPVEYLWPRYPAVVRQAFVEAFTTGLRCPEARAPASEWAETMVAAMNRIGTCSSGHDTFVDRGSKMADCNVCASPLRPVLLAVVGEHGDHGVEHELVVGRETKITGRHLDRRAAVGKVLIDTAKGSDGGWAIRNRTSRSLEYSDVFGATERLAPYGSVPAANLVELRLQGPVDSRVAVRTLYPAGGAQS